MEPKRKDPREISCTNLNGSSSCMTQHPTIAASPARPLLKR